MRVVLSLISFLSGIMAGSVAGSFCSLHISACSLPFCTVNSRLSRWYASSPDMEAAFCIFLAVLGRVYIIRYGAADWLGLSQQKVRRVVVYAGGAAQRQLCPCEVVVEHHRPVGYAGQGEARADGELVGEEQLVLPVGARGAVAVGALPVPEIQDGVERAVGAGALGVGEDESRHCWALVLSRGLNICLVLNRLCCGVPVKRMMPPRDISSWVLGMCLGFSMGYIVLIMLPNPWGRALYMPWKDVIATMPVNARHY